MLRTAAAVAGARAVGAASRRLRRGGGTALPGLVAERIDPRLVANLARQLGGNASLMALIISTQTIAAAATLPLVHGLLGRL